MFIWTPSPFHQWNSHDNPDLNVARWKRGRVSLEYYGHRIEQISRCRRLLSLAAYGTLKHNELLTFNKYLHLHRFNVQYKERDGEMFNIPNNLDKAVSQSV